MADVGALVVRISANAEELYREFSRAGKAGTDFGEVLGKSAKGIALALAAAAASAVVLVKQVGEQAEATQRLATITGLSTDRIQEWDAVFRRSGGSVENLTQATRTLSQQLVAANESSGESRRAFSRLGIDARDLGQNAEAAFTAVIEKLSAMPAGFERTAVASQLLGRGMADLLPAFAQGAEEFKKTSQEARDFGAVVSGPQLEALAKADDAFDRLALATKGFANQLAVVLAPAVTTIINDLTSMTAATTQLVASMTPSPWEGQAKEIAKFRDELKLTDAEMQKIAARGVTVTKAGAPTEALSAAELAKASQAAQQALTGAAAVKWDAEGLRLYIDGLTSMSEEVRALAKAQATQQATLRAAEDHNIAISIANQQAKTQAENDAFLAHEAAMNAAFIADVEREKKADREVEEKRGQFTQNRLNQEAQAAAKTADIWTMQLASIQQGFAFAWGQITNQISGALAQQIVFGNDWANTLKSLAASVLQGLINLGIQMAVNWVAAEATRASATVAANATIAASNTATAALSVSTMTSAAQAVSTALVAMGASVMQALLAVWTVAKAVLQSIATAMKASVFGIVVGIAITAALAAGAVLVRKASQEAAALLAAAALVGGVSTGLAIADLVDAASAAADVGSFSDLGFVAAQHGGIFTGPTLAMVGEAGPEAVIPLRHLDGLGGEQHINIYLDGDVLTAATLRGRPRVAALYGFR